MVGPIAIPNEIARAARRAVRSEASLQAVLLFGSRARGDHRPDSDWDIALVTDIEVPRRSQQPPAGWSCSKGGATFDFLRISAERLELKANAILNIACPIAREAVLLAGHWQPPTLESPIMEVDEYARHILDAEASMDHACTLLSSLPDGEYPQRDAVACGRFVTSSADAAELLLKAMLGRRGNVPKRTHDVRQLASAFEEPAIRAAALALDGDAQRDHTAHYSGFSAEDVRRAVARLSRTANLYLFELREATGGGESAVWAKGYLGAAEGRIRSFALRLRGAKGVLEHKHDEAVKAALSGRRVLPKELWTATIGTFGRVASSEDVTEAPQAPKTVGRTSSGELWSLGVRTS